MVRFTFRRTELISANLSSKGIYVVRGIAALLVLFLHITSILIPQKVWIDQTGPLKYFMPWLFRGEVGVGVFIFLSGFLLTLNIPKSGLEWSRFYLRRFSRIYPVYGLLLLVSISTSRLWDFHGFLNALFLLPNFPGTLWPAPWLSTAWSLGVEWTLYLLFPFFLFSIRSRPWNIYLLILFLEFMIFFGHSIGTDFHTLVYGSILGRAIEFMLGMVLALNINKLKSLRTIQFVYLLLTTFTIFHIWCLWYLQSGGSTSESYLRMVQPFAESLFGLTLILIFQIPTNWFINSLLTPIAFVGVISYPLYLTHLVVLDGINKYSAARPESVLYGNIGLQSLLIVLGSLILAWIIHESIEKPGMKLGRTSK